jgi:hypothetical protein
MQQEISCSCLTTLPSSMARFIEVTCCLQSGCLAYFANSIHYEVHEDRVEAYRARMTGLALGSVYFVARGQQNRLGCK